MSSDFKIVAGQVIPAMTVSLPFNCEIHLEKIFDFTNPTQSIKAFTSPNGFLFVDQPADHRPLDVHWASLIRIARNCAEQNVTLNRLNGSNQLQLCTTRTISMDECLRLWPSHSLLTEWNIPDYLQLANFLSVNQYKCTNCSKVYEEPNQLKVHIALTCGKSYDAAAKSAVDSSRASLASSLMVGSNIGLSDNPHQLINQLINKHSMCNNLLLNHSYQSSLKNSSSSNLGFNPFPLALPNCNLTKSQETILKQQNSNTSLAAGSNHALATGHSSQPPDNLSGLALSGLAAGNLGGGGFNSLALNNGLNNSLNNSLSRISSMSSSLISHNISNLLNHSNSLLSLANSGNYAQHSANLLIKQRKLEESNDLISTLNKLNILHENGKNQQLNGNPLLNGGGGGGLPKGSGQSNGGNKNPLEKLNINLIDSDQSNDEMLSDKVSSSGLISVNPHHHHHHHLPTKNRAMKLTKEPRQHTCKFCGKLYTRKYGLKIHIRTHTGHKPLKCIHCSRQFSDPSNLNKHHRLHQNSLSSAWSKRIEKR